MFFDETQNILILKIKSSKYLVLQLQKLLPNKIFNKVLFIHIILGNLN